MTSTQATARHPITAPPRALLLPYPGSGRGPAEPRPIPPAGLLLGRGASAFRRPFEDLAMSPRHAEILHAGGRAVVRDLGSGALTRVNGVDPGPGAHPGRRGRGPPGQYVAHPHSPTWSRTPSSRSSGSPPSRS